MSKDPRLTDNLEKAMEIAEKTAGERGSTFIGSEHMLYGF